jgi:hypothetical protein
VVWCGVVCSGVSAASSEEQDPFRLLAYIRATHTSLEAHVATLEEQLSERDEDVRVRWTGMLFLHLAPVAWL